MKQLISPAQMQECEAKYFASSGVPSIEIMEHAARALADAAREHFPKAKTAFIACGPGGNGGDGYACARMLKQAGLNCAIFAPVPARSPDAIENARRAGELGIAIAIGELPQDAPDLWIDCLYGTGMRRAPEGFSADLIRRINQDHSDGCGVVACDIPSGLNGFTGRAWEDCVQADVTVTFQIAKHGHFLQDGLDACGRIIIADVGFPGEIFPEKMPALFEPDDLRGLFIPRRRNIHKGSCGHLLIIAGSVGMAGAAALCAEAALRSGVGLVSIACPEEIVPILQVHAPCAMCVPLPQRDGAISIDALPVLEEALKGKSAFAAGPGLSRRVPAEMMRALLESALPGAIDADALNIISENPDLKSLLRRRHVITPHPGEAARLLGHRCEDPFADARALADLGCTAVLKGASRVICDGDGCRVSASGSGGMARGGSGDVLTGILGALLAEKCARDFLQAALCACEVHGLAGAAAYEKLGRSMNAADIIDFLPEVFKRYAP